MRLTLAEAMCPEVMCSRRLAAQPLDGRANAQRVISAHLLDLGHASVTPREASRGPWAAPSGSCGTVRWSRVTLGSADASGTFRVASHGRRHAHFAPSAYKKKNACNGRLDSGLSGRKHDISRFKSSFIPPVRSPEAWGARPSELRTCRNHSNTPYLHSGTRGLPRCE